MATRILDLDWSTDMTDDLSLGLHVFTLGWLPAAETENVKKSNAVADQIALGSAAPSASDAAEILGSPLDVRIPRTLAQLRCSVENVHAFWRAMLGPGHILTTRILAHRNALQAREGWLELVIPRNNVPQVWVPALLARRLQVDCQVWMSEQGRSDYPVALLALEGVFTEIARKRDWAPDLPDAHFQFAPVIDDQHTLGGISGATGETNSMTTDRTGASRRGGPALPPAGDSTAQTQRPAHNNNPEPIYDEFSRLGLKTQKVKEHCASKNITWPTVRPRVPFCASFRVKHMCNTRCRAAADHQPHSAEEAERMVAWCRENCKVE